MARPREFDETEVLDRALHTFWSKGFDGTSMEDLVAATGLARASLYGAFGDKEKLFARVVDHYVSLVDAASCDARVGEEVDALRAIAAGWVSGTCRRGRPRGCFLSLAAIEGASTTFARDALLRSLRADERKLARLIEAGQRSGAIRGVGAADELARLLVVVQQGVSTAARAGVPARDLERAVAVAVDLVVGA